MTKARLILDLYSQLSGTMPEHKLPAVIADRIGTTDSYVRTVARQRKGRGACEAEIRYQRSPLGRLTRQRNCASYYARIKADPERYEVLKEKWRHAAKIKYRRRRAEANQLA